MRLASLMKRRYHHAERHLQLLERAIAERPGATIASLQQVVGLSYTLTAKYLRLIARRRRCERRIQRVARPKGGGALVLFYPRSTP